MMTMIMMPLVPRKGLLRTNCEESLTKDNDN